MPYYSPQWKRNSRTFKDYLIGILLLFKHFLAFSLILEAYIVVLIVLYHFDYISDAKIDGTMYTILGIGLSFLLGVCARGCG